MKKEDQARLRLVVDNDSDGGYKSGRNRWRGTPVAASIGKTRSAGTRSAANQSETDPCDFKPNRRAKAVCPPARLQASSNASLDMNRINAQTGNSVNAYSVNTRPDNRAVARQPMMRASEFWKRLEDTLGRNPNWQPFNANNVATKLSMSQGSVHRWYLGTGLPELKTALYLAAEAGVCVDWLLNNVKPKYPLSHDPLLRTLLEICEDLDEDGVKAVLRSAEGEALRKQIAPASTKQRA